MTENINWDEVASVEAGFDETFKFESHGDHIIGLFAGMQTVDTDDGEATAAVLATGDGRVGVWVNHDLKQKLKKVDEGMTVRIEYVDDRSVNRGSPMKIYDLKAV